MMLGEAPGGAQFIESLTEAIKTLALLYASTPDARIAAFGAVHRHDPAGSFRSDRRRPGGEVAASLPQRRHDREASNRVWRGFTRMRRPSDAPPRITVPIAIPRHTVDSLRSEARRRGMRADELASAILSNIVADDLFLAVLDH